MDNRGQQPLMPDRGTAQQRATRLRIAGGLILAAGIVGACVLYWIGIHSNTPTLEDLMPGSTAARERQVGIVIGTFGVDLIEGWEYVQRPESMAVISVVVTALVAIGCFRVAALIARDHDSR